MKKFRLSIAFVLMALVLAIVPAASAQGEMFNATEEEFALWSGAFANTFSADSFGFDLSVLVTVAGIEGSDVDVNLTGSGVIDTNAENPQVQLDLSGSVKSGDETEDVTLGLIIVDGIAYVNDGTGWQGSPLEDLQSSLTEMGGIPGLPVNAEALASGDLSGVTGMEGFAEAMTALSEIDWSNYFNLETTEAGGATDFSLTFDLPGMLGDPALAPMMGAAMGGGAEMTDAQMQQMAMMLPMMFTGTEIALNQSVDNETEMLNSVELVVNLPLENMLGPGAVVAVNLGIEFKDYNVPVSVEAPADAVMADS